MCCFFLFEWYNICKLMDMVLYEKQEATFEITNAIFTLVAESAELTGKLSSLNHLAENPTLRRANRIRTITSLSRFIPLAVSVACSIRCFPGGIKPFPGCR